MNLSNRSLMAMASLLLVALYFMPFWSIHLDAPQYPERLGLNISIDRIEGKEEGQLQSINGLNHYIGMQEIKPDSIPELKIMPYIVGALILLGLIIALVGDHRWVLGWLILFIILGIAGFIDFYIWEYNYGHNLDPDAAIQVPGMTYQPPLIGSKKMLNITATSLPHIGFFFALASMILAGTSWYRSRNEAKAADQGAPGTEDSDSEAATDQEHAKSGA